MFGLENIGSWLGGAAKATGGWLEDPANRNLLAGMGTRIGGPGSVGEAIGVPTMQREQSRAMQKVLGEQEAGNKEWRDMLGGYLKMLAQGPTPKGTPGINTAVFSDEGLKLDIAKPVSPVGAAGEAGLPPGGYPYDFSKGAISQPPAKSTSSGGGYNLQDIIPFS